MKWLIELLMHMGWPNQIFTVFVVVVIVISIIRFLGEAV